MGHVGSSRTYLPDLIRSEKGSGTEKGGKTSLFRLSRVIGQKVCLGASTSYWDKGLLSGTLTRRFLTPIPSVHLHP